MLVANKIDLEDERVVQEREGQALANKYGVPFMEISARTGLHVNTMFSKMGELLL
jgi:Ras-related protein Rab-8A